MSDAEEEEGLSINTSHMAAQRVGKRAVPIHSINENVGSVVGDAVVESPSSIRSLLVSRNGLGDICDAAGDPVALCIGENATVTLVSKHQYSRRNSRTCCRALTPSSNRVNSTNIAR